MKKVAVVGAAGQLGQSFCRALSKSSDVELACLDRKEAKGVQQFNAACEESVSNMMCQFQPSVVINCAAAGNVNRCETDEAYARAGNVTVPANLARACQEWGATLVHISTNYVFGGEALTPYREDSKPEPCNQFGYTMLQGEECLVGNYLVIRTGGVFGEGDNFITSILRKAKNGNLIDVVCDQVTRPTWAEELARACLALLRAGASGVFHLTNSGDEVSWCELAREALRIQGIPLSQVTPVDTPQWNVLERGRGVDRPAIRPRYSVLDISSAEAAGVRMQPWPDALTQYLSKQ